MLSIIIEHFLLIHIQDGYTALQVAAYEGQLDVVKLLVENKAIVDLSINVRISRCAVVCWFMYWLICTKQGVPTALILTLGNGYEDVGMYLIEQHASLETSDSV